MSRPVDIDALAEAFAGVQRLGQPPPKGRAVAPAPSVVAARPAAPVALQAPPAASPPPTPAPDELSLLRDAMRGVRPLGGGSARPSGATAPPARTPTSGITPIRAHAAPAGSGALVPRELMLGLERERDAALARASAAEAELAREREARAATDTVLVAAEARAASLAAELHGAHASLSSTTDRAREHSRAATEARAEVAGLRADSRVSAPASLRTLAAERGLLGDDELSAALRAILEVRRGGPLFDHLVAQNPEALAAFFAERLILVGEGEEAPGGRVAVRVSMERSELREDGAVKKALERFSTACLVHGKRRIVFVGGSPGYRRQLREGLDRRLDLRFVEGDQRRIPRVDADLVIVWGATELDHAVSLHFPDAMVVPHRGIARMLGFVVERLDGAPG